MFFFFLKTKIEYLGHEISDSHVQPTQQKTEAIAKFPTPTNVHQVRQYLGLTGYFRKYIPNYAMKARYLSSLLTKDAKWEWGKNQENAFETLKQILANKPVLALFDPGKDLKLYTDACRWGLAGILVQFHGNAEEVVAYFSRQTTRDEQKFHSFELETLAIVSSVKRFRQYLLGCQFTI